jgi:methionyl-tRNA formyltransferase
MKAMGFRSGEHRGRPTVGHDRQHRAIAPQRSTSGQREDVVADEAAPPKLRVLFVTEDDPLYVFGSSISFCRISAEEFEICGITIDRAFHEPIWKRWAACMASTARGGLFVRACAFIDARLRGRSIASLARSAGIPLVWGRSVNQPEYIAQVRAMAPDVIVSVAAPEVFKLELLKVPRLGCINIHSGRLPMYRGMMPTFWQMLRGEKETNDHGASHGREARCWATCWRHRISPSRHSILLTGSSSTKREGARLVIRVLLDLRAGPNTAEPARYD